jgi:hypothetical protein
MLAGIHVNAPGALGPRPVIYASPDGINWLYLGLDLRRRAGLALLPRRLAVRGGAAFLPAPVVLADGRVIASLRYQRDARYLLWSEIHESLDGGRTWRWLSRVNDWGAPGDLVPMADGRVVCVYGYRRCPPACRYRVSEDGGRSWGREMILRDDGGSWDVGYPRVIELAPGRLLTTYYINRKDDRIQMNGGVRHIAATVFEP